MMSFIAFIASFHNMYSVFFFRMTYFHVEMVIIKESKKMPSNNAGSCLDKILADVSKQSATKQILIGAASGW